VLDTTEGRVGLGLGALMVVLVVLGPALAPYPPGALGLGTPAAGPSRRHLLGLDGLGRDVLSRFLAGGGSVVLVPLAAVTLAFLVGGALGLFAAYRGGLVDQLLERLVDVLLTIPPLLFVLVVVAQAGTSRPVLVGVVGLVLVPWVARVVRGTAHGVVTADYVAAAETRGERVGWILRREILPNVAGPVVSAFGLYLTSAIVFVSTLSFLGLGEQPPSPDWGLAVAESRGLVSVNPWATLAPALGIGGLATSAMLLSDAALRRLDRDTGMTAWR
jgi:peptide/nickel transport system permease protein